MSKRPKTRQTLEEILASCSDTLFPDQMGIPPLHVMLWRDDTYGALCLINPGADENAVGDMSETPLHVAVCKQNLEVARLLFANGATPDAMSEFGKTPRMMAKTPAREMRQLLSRCR